MATSGKIINYQLRPAKSVERKMLKDIFLKVNKLSNLRNFQYVGFGSHYFSDFILFHKSLHIDRLISIERDISSQLKYNFNQPFKCINIEFGESNDVLPSLDFTSPTILWLDYDKRFSPEMLNDIDTFVQNCCSKSILLVSFNSQPHRISNLKKTFETDEEDGLFERAIRQEVSDIYFPADFQEQGIRKWDAYSNLIRKAVIARIIDTLQGRNIGGDKINFKQVCFFNYEDGVEMTTIGYIFLCDSDEQRFAEMEFEDLEFYSTDDQPYNIEIPNLTFKEIKTLMENMPDVDKKKLPKGVFTDKDISSFRKIYKYFPTYMDIEYT